MRSTFPLLAILALLAPAAALSGWGDFEYDFDADKKPWQEVQAQLPAYPKAGHLIPFEVSSASRHKHFIDSTSLSAGEDGVVRYTVVVKTSGGAENVSFEGLRCTTGERKLYAFGRSDGKGGGEWSRNRYARWEPIPARQAASYQRELFFHYFCTVDGPGDMQVIRRALGQGGIRRGEE
ncbi:MAG TPA: CNP1-like family protein [Thiobacillaceae bacterium]|nr:CNP1-like family protein [Thiobacillaceae bacterium]